MTKKEVINPQMEVDFKPREKLITSGSSYLTNVELLAILLDTGTKEQNVLQLADELLHFAGSINNLPKLDVKMLQKVKGVGPAKACKIVASMELASRALKSDLLEMPQITSPSKVIDYFKYELSSLNVEIVKLVCLDAKNRITFSKNITKGTTNMSLVSVKDIYKEAMLRDACGIIVIHNHPSGDPTPSRNDIDVTNNLKKAGEIVGIPLIDHLIYGCSDKVYSFMKEDTI
ncbi:MAG: DNA repair protein RadC [Peptostreptococcaceae bacterium]|nr:DNA repair protein RadC [Peptostreptococcaceae bacterium]